MMQDKPREKCLNLGAERLTDAELLAILLKTGAKGKPALALAEEMLDYFGSLAHLLRAGPAEFCQFSGAGLVKYATLQAAKMVATRYWQSTPVKRLTWRNFAELEQFLLAKLSHREQEVFAAIFLTAKLEALAYEELFYGSVSSNTVYPRELLKRALKHNAAALIIAHNHPSGDPTPSSMDKRLTSELSALCQAVEIRLLLHIVVGHNRCQPIEI